MYSNPIRFFMRVVLHVLRDVILVNAMRERTLRSTPKHTFPVMYELCYSQHNKQHENQRNRRVHKGAYNPFYVIAFILIRTCPVHNSYYRVLKYLTSAGGGKRILRGRST